MNKIFKKAVFLGIISAMLLCCGILKADYVNKITPGMPFTYFELDDVFHQRWVSTYLRGKPIIILTGHRFQRYEILKWAESLRQEYSVTGKAYLLWAVNLKNHRGSRGTIVSQWRNLNAPVPVLLDWRGVIGDSLRINYNVPNIILVDAFGRLLMHEMATYSPEMYSAVSLRIQNLLISCPAYPTAGYKPVVTGYVPSPKGKRADSN